jgi:lipid A ethanolaminephosphotransferase
LRHLNSHLDGNDVKFREILALRTLPTLSANQLLLVTVAYLALTQNQSLFGAVLHSLPRPLGGQEWRILASTVFALITLLSTAMAGLCWPRMQKPALAFFVLTAAISSYFMHSFGTVIDRAMIANAFNTNVHEAGDLLTFDFFMHTLLLGVLPAWIISRVPLRYESFGVELRRRLALVGLLLGGLIVILFSQYNTLSFWGRQHRDVRLYVNPTAPMYAFKEMVADLLPKGPPVPLLVVAPDAKRISTPGAKPLLVILVVGETARAANFGIDGYARNTTPRLSAIPELINYPHFESCGTATLESVPCIFSRLNQSDFSRKKARAEENLLDIVARTGVPVIWRDNNAGCMGTCVRTGSISLESEKDPKLCADGECHDDILLKDFDTVLPKAAGSATFLVLHQKGSHGPAYFKRYPENARHFTPDCRTESVQRCTREEVVNAYDNTIVYTDTMLANLIEQLRTRQDSVDSVMIYVSDHGESLGENGIYLHGLPRQLAPDEQTHIPMMAWFSAHAPAALKLDLACIKTASNRPGSHDNLFDSILDLLSIRTGAYRPAQDLFAVCQKH